MSFEAKRLRIQLPCDGGSLIEEAPAAKQVPQTIGTATITGTLCRIPSVACQFPTNPCQDFNSFCNTIKSLCEFPTHVCHFPTNACHGFASPCQAFASPCGGFASPCPANTNPCGTAPSICRAGSITPTITETICGVSEQTFDPGTIVIEAEHLPALREQLEAQLKEIEIAEKALEEHGKEG